MNRGGQGRTRGVPRGRGRGFGIKKFEGSEIQTLELTLSTNVEIIKSPDSGISNRSEEEILVNPPSKIIHTKLPKTLDPKAPVFSPKEDKKKVSNSEMKEEPRKQSPTPKSQVYLEKTVPIVREFNVFDVNKLDLTKPELFKGTMSRLPFIIGKERDVYLCELQENEIIKPYLAIQTRGQLKDLMVEADTKNICSDVAEMFNERNVLRQLKISFPRCFISIENNLEIIYLLEEYFPMKGVQQGNSKFLAKVSSAFSHFSWIYSKENHDREIIIQDFTCVENGKVLLFTSPKIFGLDDCSSQIKNFFTSHQCNSVCRSLELRPHPDQTIPDKTKHVKKEDSKKWDHSISPVHGRTSSRCIDHIRDGVNFFDKQSKANNQLYQHFMLSQKMKKRGLKTLSNFSEAITACLETGIISKEEETLLREINREGNGAKHDMSLLF